MSPRIITTTQELETFCAEAARCAYVTVDTEFLRERTYYSQLCLVQLAYRGPEGEEDAVLVDPLSELSLAPLYTLFQDQNVVKVFHAARQDIEIFVVDGADVPSPLFDTQIAAMVCGFGEQVGYETLVRKVVKAEVDKSSRFTNWAQRPLSDAQQRYALSDVTYLRDIYEHLQKRLEKTNRADWVAEELAVLQDKATYLVAPEMAYKRVKARSQSPRFLTTVRELAAFREGYAQDNDVPRSRVFKDDALLELASSKPKAAKDLMKSRLLLRDARKGAIADGILRAIQRALAVPDKDIKVQIAPVKRQVNPAQAELLRVLLKAKADDAGVAQRLIASAADIDALASGEFEDLATLKGWRLSLFGEEALRLCQGDIALALQGSRVISVPIEKVLER